MLSSQFCHLRSSQPEISSPPRFRIQGGQHKRHGRRRRRTEILLSNIGYDLTFYIVQKNIQFGYPREPLTLGLYLHPIALVHSGWQSRNSAIYRRVMYPGQFHLVTVKNNVKNPACGQRSALLYVCDQDCQFYIMSLSQ